MKLKISIIVVIIALVVLAQFVPYETAYEGQNAIPDKISYNYDVRPILSDKCFACHGPDKNKQEAGLRLDLEINAKAPLKETKGAFAIIPGNPDKSELIKRITSTDPSYQMPTPESHLGLLNEREVKLLTAWIKQGAKYEKHWAFIAPKKAPLPKIKDKEWAKNEIDYFVAEKIQQHGLKASKEADKDLLLKRIALDLTGLLPSISLMDAFNADKTEKAYEKAIDKLLATPQFGEKMAIHWLDVARYSDSYGYQDDNIRTQWPYRDWVIHAFNKNMPYNQFITWQLAGDLLPNAGKEQILATAFLRNHKYTEEGGVIPEEYRVEYTIDKVKTYSKGLLALTAECAQCHDHKYDPISQKDYYQLFAFFNTSKEKGFEGDVSQSKPAKTPILTLTNDDTKKILKFINRKDTNSLMVSVMEEADTPRTTFLLSRGLYDQYGEKVQAQALPAVMNFDIKNLPRNRLGLAKWTVDRNNPVTARVFVNQLWEQFFGRGIVKTTGDFGMQGNLPSHPELLDWLAVDFMEHGWNVKRLVKQILLSATYRQSSNVTEKHLKTDPENIYLSRRSRARLPAELIRDIVLGSSGLLNLEIGGPSVKPYQPKGLWETASSGRGQLATYRQDKGKDLYRRGIYTFIKLTIPPPTMIVFDASNRDQCEVQRLNTNTPLQALIMMNDPMVLEASRVLAQRIDERKLPPSTAIETIFRSVICRKPKDKELQILNDYYADQLALFTSKKSAVEKVLQVGEYPQSKKIDKHKAAALTRVINMIYNMEEAITKT